jgi:hypothetical protein
MAAAAEAEDIHLSGRKDMGEGNSFAAALRTLRRLAMAGATHEALMRATSPAGSIRLPTPPVLGPGHRPSG